MVTSHPEVVRKLHAWRIDFDRSRMRSAFIAYVLDIPFYWILVSNLFSIGMMRLCILSRATLFYSQSLTEVGATSTTMVSM